MSDFNPMPKSLHGTPKKWRATFSIKEQNKASRVK